jgi:hypothetical protein
VDLGQERRAVESGVAEGTRCSPLPDFERDLSRDGAGIRLAAPTESRLSLDGLRSAVTVELIRRDGDFAGIAFRRATSGLEHNAQRFAALIDRGARAGTAHIF